MTVAAFLDMVAVRKNLPVAFLLEAEQPRAAAEGTAVLEGLENGVADKGRAIGYPFESREKLLVGLEGDDLFFPCHAWSLGLGGFLVKFISATKIMLLKRSERS